MESVVNAVSLAATAASLALDASTDAVAPLWAQLQLILSAALQVTEAFWLLLGEALGQAVRAVLTHPKLAVAVIGVPVVSVALNVGRWLINLSWERGLRDSRSGRLQSAGRRLAEVSLSYSSGESDMDEARYEEAEKDERSPDEKADAARPDPPSILSVLQEKRLSLMSFFMGGFSGGTFSKSDECLQFLVQRAEDVQYESEELVFQQGTARSAFLVVKQGEVVVEHGCRSADVYSLGPGNAVVGLLFMLASISTTSSSACSVHSSSARAGAQGALVTAVPLEAFQDAFERFPKAMQRLVQRLSVRFSTVVFDTLSTYFGLRHEFMTSSTFKANEAGLAELREMSPAEAFRPLLRCCGEKGEKELERAERVCCEAGNFAIPPQSRAKHLMILLEGDLAVEIPGDSSSARVSPGDAIGELSILTDKPSLVHYRCISRCTFAALSREVCTRLLEDCPRDFTLTLLHLIVGRTATWLHRVDACLDWLTVEGSSCLYRQGDEMSGFFMVLSGRLVALEKVAEVKSKRVPGPLRETSQTERVTDLLQRGRLCGELDCLRKSCYSQTVRACRDSELCRVSPTLLQLIAMDFPQAILHFSSYIGSRPSQSEDVSSAKHKTTITVVPATADVDIHEVCSNLTSALSKLGKTMHISPSTDLFFSPGLKGSARSLDEGRLGRLLADMEERSRWLVYEAEPCGASITDWTKRCVRQADHILVAANFNGQGRGDVPQTPNERYVQDAAPLYVSRELLLLHKGAGGKTSQLASMDDWFVGSAAHADALKPGVSGFVRHHLFVHKGRKCQRSTRHYLNQRSWARRWHHVRLGPEDARDWARVARLIAGKAVGVCFGGGGARGNVHFGVIKAMQELGIPIDVVSGTSFGALAAAMYAISAPEPSSLQRVVTRVMTTQPLCPLRKLKRRIPSRFSTRKLLWDLTFPRTANFTGAFLNAMLKEIFARRRCEDLLIPFSCTSTDIVQFEEKVHRDGPLWRVVRASMSLVGIAPPLPHQERREDGKVSTTLLVDGGYSNQYPIEVLKEHGAGIVICVECCPDYSPVCTDYGDAVWGGLVTLKRRLMCCRRSGGEPDRDPPTQAEIQERLMYLVEALKDPHKERADLVISPDVSPYSLLDMPKYKEIIDLGYNTARVALGHWLAEAPESTQEIIRAARAEEHVAKSLNEVEYGSRLTYATWRKNATRVARKLLKRRSRTVPENLDEAEYEAESEGG
ncbi:unnamed protein product [Durusdinium trenchii]|uniref:Patatin n=1 Tax=Durusdinium trenchii TaxID=1381693 RepID=A0ABP0RGG3_9DINO